MLGRFCCRAQVHTQTSEKYAREHDEGIWSTVKALLVEVPGSEQELADAVQVATTICQRSHRRRPTRSGALVSSGNPRHDWTVKGSGGDQLGSGCRVKPENSKRAQFNFPAFKNTTKIPPKDPKRGKEKRKLLWRRGWKKRAKFWAHPSHPSGLHPLGPHPSRAPHSVVPKFNMQ